ncbi:MAG: TonB-dependent receptor [Myxococcales bacterium]|nr:TonB-dependent receptor [Myxococcales bacterium]MCB9707497.1 TonB-dependent receptor [Myxococcales bacterium]
MVERALTVAILALGLQDIAPKSIAMAQDSKPKVVSPRLIQFVEADYPPGLLEQEARVEMALTISATGKVTHVDIVESAGEAFDRAAQAAATAFVFSPARLGNKPVASRIRYRYVFELRPPTAPKTSVAAKREASASFSPGVVSNESETISVTARVDAPPREVTRRTIRSDVLVRVPGTRGDPLRAVELLPGVGRPPFTAGALIVRGSAPGDSQTQLEGLPLPLLYHFGGLTSVIHPRLLDRIDFYPGNFGAKFGRRTGGILDVTLRAPKDDGFHGVLDVNIIDASLLFEGPIGDKGGFAVAARRSYVDLVLEAALPDDDVSIVAAPVYWDYQGIVNYRLTPRDRLRLMVYGSRDTLRLLFQDPSESDPAFRGNFGVRSEFHRVHMSWFHQFSKALNQKIDVSLGLLELEVELGNDVAFNLSSVEVLGRSEWNWRLSPVVGLIAGLDIRAQPSDFYYRGPQPTQEEGDPSGGISGRDPISTQPLVLGQGSLMVYEPAAYLTVDLRPIEQLQILLGTRLDWFGVVRRWALDPRLAVRYSLNQKTTLKAGVGSFSQPPVVQEASEEFGNPSLRPIRSLHVSGGLEHKVDDVYSFGAEAFYKHLWDRVVSTQGAASPFFINDGIGRIYGLEVLARAEPKGRFFGFLSYTLSRSERRDRAEDWRLFDFDQTHILTLSGVYKLGAGWETGATFRLVSGNPFTPIAGGIYDANVDVYQPIYGSVNSKRNKLFHRLDLRIEKQWKLHYWQLAVYLDVQNVYNAENPEGTVYNYDFTETGAVRGLPIIPSLGVRGEF